VQPPQHAVCFHVLPDFAFDARDVLVIYGSGHLFWLQRDILDSADLELARLSEYAK
jgi:hypothetical protein